MKARLPLFAVSLLLALTAASCAVVTSEETPGTTAYARPTVDPARVGLPPIYRPFFDALKDDGDWTLIEPFGWCFRPRVNYVAWRPYLDGWWEPTESWGWVWNTYEPFGWITYHYGNWFYDSYQGWVWQPAPVWGPAWVAWVQTGDYVGWAPLGPSQWDAFAQVPGGLFTYSDMRQLASREVGQQALYLTRLPESAAPAREIENVGHADGVSFNRGPDFSRLQQLGAPVPERTDGAAPPRVRLGAAPARPNEADLRSRTTRVAAEAVREWRQLREHGVAPPPPPPGGMRPAPRPAPPDAGPPGGQPGHGSREHGDEPRRPAHGGAELDSTAGHERPAGRDSTRGH